MSENLTNPDAEALVIAALLKYPEEYWSINDVGLLPSDFIGVENQRTLKAIQAVANGKKQPDLPLVLEEIRLLGYDSTPDYAVKLTEQPISVNQSREFVRTVKGLSVARSLANAGTKIIEIARSNRSDYDTAIGEAESALHKVKRILPPEERGTSAADIITRLDTRVDTPAVPIRFSPSLHLWTGGLVPGNFWVIGGFSSVGKSAFCVNMALDVARRRGSIPSIMSLEMTSEQYMLRMLSVLSGVSQRALRQGVTLPMDNLEKLNTAKINLAKSGLHIDDTVRTIEHIRSRATRQKETVGLDVLFVDFIQNVYVKGDEFADARAVALELQNIAKDLSCTVVGFSQVSNEMAKRDADGADRNYYSFKGHGAIRDAADVAIMLRRDRVAQSTALNVQVVKNRHDQLGEFYCNMDLETGAIVERMEYEDE
jgi:replicative DNA helicase